MLKENRIELSIKNNKMKQIILLILGISFFNHAIIAQSSNLLNKTWKIERFISVNGIDTMVYFHKDSSSNYYDFAQTEMIFQNNGQFSGKNSSGDSQTGTWSIVATNDSLVLNNETFAINQLSTSTLITKNSIRQTVDTFGNTSMATLYLVFYPSTSVLPITLISFEGKAENAINHITWQTESEVNSDYFVIEKSEDAIHWQNLTKVAAVGNSNKTNTYKTIDNQPYRLTYYRLLSGDKDGTKTFSKIISIVQSKNNPASLKIYPNPVRNTFTLEYTQAVTSLKIMNLYGQLLKTIEPNEFGKTEMDTSDFASGMYWIRINDQQLVKFVKM
jgi:Secretion system C-terminal sorting domain